MRGYACPACHGDNIQRLAAIYEGGLYDLKTRTRGHALGFGAGALGVIFGRGKTKGTAQTAASQRAAPPPKKKILKPIGIIFALYMISNLKYGDNQAALLFIYFAHLASAAAWLTYALRFNIKTWPTLKRNWDQSFLCNRCNRIFRLQTP